MIITSAESLLWLPLGKVAIFNSQHSHVHTHQPKSSAGPPAGACQHALGYHAAAAADYQAAMEVERGDAGDEVRAQQLAAFYQRELALYRHRRLDRPIADFCPDHDLHPVFKARPRPRTCSPCLS